MNCSSQSVGYNLCFVYSTCTLILLMNLLEGNVFTGVCHTVNEVA